MRAGAREALPTFRKPSVMRLHFWQPSDPDLRMMLEQGLQPSASSKTTSARIFRDATAFGDCAGSSHAFRPSNSRAIPTTATTHSSNPANPCTQPRRRLRSIRPKRQRCPSQHQAEVHTVLRSSLQALSRSSQQKEGPQDEVMRWSVVTCQNTLSGYLVILCYDNTDNRYSKR